MSAMPSTKRAVKLSQLAQGTKFRLFAKYRDGSPRPRLKFNSLYLTSHELEVVGPRGSAILCLAAGKLVPLEPTTRIAP